MQLTNPEQLTTVLNSLVMDASERFELNKKLANHSRQYFRDQIRKQQDIDGHAYHARKTKRITLDRKTQKVKSNKNMLTGFSRALRTQVTDRAFEVGIAGVAGNMAKVHNNGLGVTFTKRAKGFYNSRTSRWEGGTRVKDNYTMTKRTLIGWTPSLERELLAMIGAEILTSAET